MTEDVGELTLQREMGCTREEFVRWLPGATRCADVKLDPEQAVIALGDGTVTISFRQAAPRRIALVSIPVLAVSFRFSRVGALARAEFMAYFDLYTKRGGG
ncbi:MAG: hypothetical protein NT123_10435 [Proteobacteria bacterium]|nr:hypothetical protein [Pseudomonadota bacterium]